MSNPRFQKLMRQLLDRPDHPLIEWEIGKLSHREFALRAIGLSRWLGLHLAPNSTVGIYLEESWDHYLSLFGLWCAGMRPVTINFLASSSQALDLLQLSQCQAVLTRSSCPQSYGAIPSLYLDAATYSCSESIPQPSMPLSYIASTSGSTGNAKAVHLKVENLLWNAEATSCAIGLTSKDRLCINIPSRAMSALCHFLSCAVTGATLIQTEQFHFGKALKEKLYRTGATGFGGVPAHFRKFLSIAEGENLETLAFIMSSGDHLDYSLIEQFSSRFPSTKIFSFYGLTELSGRFCFLDPEQIHQKKGSVGRPIDSMKLRIERESGKSAAVMEVGEVVAFGPMVMEGYLGETQSSHLDSGLRTGDMGYLDDEGYLWLVDRKDDVFKSGGEKISLIHLESELRKLMPLLEVVASPGRDPVLGRVPIVFYESAKSFSERKILELKNQLSENLPRNHVPNKFICMSELPRLESGKYDRKRLATLGI